MSLHVRVGPLAQLVEQQTLNLRVRGSSPWRLTTFSSALPLHYGWSPTVTVQDAPYAIQNLRSDVQADIQDLRADIRELREIVINAPKGSNPAD